MLIADNSKIFYFRYIKGGANDVLFNVEQFLSILSFLHYNIMVSLIYINNNEHVCSLDRL